MNLCVFVQLLGQQGKAGFYSGGVAEAIVDVIRENGGVMTPEDLGSHDSQEITPISTDYKVQPHPGRPRATNPCHSMYCDWPINRPLDVRLDA